MLSIRQRRTIQEEIRRIYLEKLGEKVSPKLQAFIRQVKIQVISNSRNEILQT